MEAKKTLTTKNWKQYLAIGGIGATVLGVSYLIFRQFKKKPLSDKNTTQKTAQTPITGSHMPKERLLQVVREMRKALFPIQMELADTFTVLTQMDNGVSLPQNVLADIAQLSIFSFSSLAFTL